MINTKTKGELGRRIEYDIEHDLFHTQNVFSDEYITPTFVEYVQKLEKENAELSMKRKAEIKIFQGIVEKKNDQLTKAKELLERLLITSCNSDVLNLLSNCSEVLRVRVEAEQFLNSEMEK